jgi:hypothetical protein
VGIDVLSRRSSQSTGSVGSGKHSIGSSSGKGHNANVNLKTAIVNASYAQHMVKSAPGGVPVPVPVAGTSRSLSHSLSVEDRSAQHALALDMEKRISDLPPITPGQSFMVNGHVVPAGSGKVGGGERERGSTKRSFRIHQQIVAERFEEMANVPIAVMCRRDAVKAAQEETLLKSEKAYIREPIEKKIAAATARKAASGSFMFNISSSDSQDPYLAAHSGHYHVSSQNHSHSHDLHKALQIAQQAASSGSLDGVDKFSVTVEDGSLLTLSRSREM